MACSVSLIPKPLVSMIIFVLSAGTLYAQNLPSSEQFNSALTTCATNSDMSVSADLLGSITSVYNGQKTQGAANLKTATKFIELFPAGDRAKIYELYTKCIAQILHLSSTDPPHPPSWAPHIVILDFVINQEGPEQKNSMGGTTLARAARFTVYNDGESSAVDCRAEWQPLTGETSTASPYFGLAPKQGREFTLTGYIASARIFDSTAKVSGTSTVRVECKNNVESNDLERYVDYDKKGLTY
jgi:hypothetical protein